MKKSLLFLFMFVLMCLLTMAQTPTKTPPPVHIPGKKEWLFKANALLTKQKFYYSEDKRYAVVFQEDGNLVIYKFPAPGKSQAVWHTHTMGRYITKCILQADGNLVLYWQNRAVWDSKSDARNKNKKWYHFGIPGTGSPPPVGAVSMIMQNDGNLVIYSDLPDGIPLWSSDTFEKN